MSQARFLTNSLFIGFLALVLALAPTGCTITLYPLPNIQPPTDQTESNTTPATGNTYTVAYSSLPIFDNGSGNRYYAFNGTTASITLTGAQGKEIYLVATNPTDKPIYASILQLRNARSVDAAQPSGTGTGSPAFSARVSSIEPDLNDTPNIVHFVDPIDYRHLQATASSSRNVQPATPQTSARSAGTADPAVGSTKTFYVDYDEDGRYTESDWKELTATLRATGNHCLVYVASDSFSDYSISASDGKLTGTALQALATEFDSLYALETAIYGQSYGDKYKNSAPSYPYLGSSNRYITPQSEKVTILVYDIEGDHQANAGIAGMFWSKDLLAASDGILRDYSTGNVFMTNQTEMFYVDSYFMDKSPIQTYSTLAHEFQHLLSYVNKTIPTGKYADTWFAEMTAMMAEDLLIKHFEDTFGAPTTPKNGTTGFNRNTDSPFQRIPTLCTSYHYGIASGFESNDIHESAAAYANAYGFGAYLLRNYGGIAIAKAMAQNEMIDQACVTTALVSLGYDENFETVFRDYALSFAQSNAVTRTLNKRVTDVTYPVYPINLWNYTYTYNYSTYTGPITAYYESGGQYNSWSFIVTRLRTAENNRNSSFTAPLTPSGKSKEKLYLVVK